MPKNGDDDLFYGWTSGFFVYSSFFEPNSDETDLSSLLLLKIFKPPVEAGPNKGVDGVCDWAWGCVYVAGGAGVVLGNSGAWTLFPKIEKGLYGLFFGCDSGLGVCYSFSFYVFSACSGFFSALLVKSPVIRLEPVPKSCWLGPSNTPFSGFCKLP